MNTFFLIVLGQIISLFGNAALRFALPLYLLRQTGSAALYGGITALAMLPALAGMLTGGALADRCRKARLMALLDLVTTGISAAAAAGLPHLPLLPLILTVLGSLYAIQGLYQPVVRACLPLLLNGTQLLRGNAVIQLVDTVDELLGPLLGAVLLEHLGIRGLLALCGGCFGTFRRDGALPAHPTGCPIGHKALRPFSVDRPAGKCAVSHRTGCGAAASCRHGGCKPAGSPRPHRGGSGAGGADFAEK